MARRFGRRDTGVQIAFAVLNQLESNTGLDRCVSPLFCFDQLQILQRGFKISWCVRHLNVWLIGYASCRACCWDCTYKLRAAHCTGIALQWLWNVAVAYFGFVDKQFLRIRQELPSGWRAPRAESVQIKNAMLRPALGRHTLIWMCEKRGGAQLAVQKCQLSFYFRP